jgi:hypothetical protein
MLRIGGKGMESGEQDQAGETGIHGFVGLNAMRQSTKTPYQLRNQETNSRRICSDLGG